MLMFSCVQVRCYSALASAQGAVAKHRVKLSVRQPSLSHKQHQQIAKIPYTPELIDFTLSKTAASTAFGDNKRYDATGVINYTAAITRCLAGNSPLPKKPYPDRLAKPSRTNNLTDTS
jgi:hypothetical protein